MDAVGHGLSSAVLAALLIGAYRHGRRDGHDLPELAIGIDAAARTLPGSSPAFATAVLGRFDTDSGRLTWLTCGHPLPITVRNGTTLTEPRARPGLPVGLGALGSVVGDVVETTLQPGDGVLFYTDGVTDASVPDGTPFGEDRLRDLFAREHTASASPHEVVRRLIRTAVEHSGQRLRDDATMIYLRWDGSGADAAD